LLLSPTPLSEMLRSLRRRRLLLLLRTSVDDAELICTDDMKLRDSSALRLLSTTLVNQVQLTVGVCVCEQ